MNKLIRSLNLVSVCFLLLIFQGCGTDDLSDINDLLFVKHEGAEMPAYIHGNGSEKVFLIILHGGPGGSGIVYRGGSIKDKIEKEYAVVYFDQRHAGMSQGSFSKEDLSIDIMVDDVMALVDVLSFKYGSDSKFFLMGHSWGGTLGTATMLKGNNQNRFKGWIEVDGGHDLTGLYLAALQNFKDIADEQIALSNSTSKWEDISDQLNDLDQNGYNSDDFSFLNQNAFTFEGTLADDDVINKTSSELTNQYLYNSIILNNIITTTVTGTIGNLILADDGLWEETSYLNRLEEITIPSLILWGRYDLVIPPIMGEEAFEAMGSTSKRIRIFERSGHSPMFGQPNDFAEEVLSFMDEHK